MEKQTILGVCPSKSNSYRIIKIGNISSLGKTNALRKYEKDFYIQCDKYRDANIDNYFEFYVDVFYPNQKSDIDNSLKVILDCLQKVKAIKNDNKCVKIVARKFLDKNNPRVEFILKKVEGF
jgi:hypothetical protein